MADPYDPPHADYPGPGSHAPPEPSGIAKTMGILSIVFASLVLLANLWSLATAATRFQPKFGHQDPADLVAAQEFTQKIMPYTLATDAMMLVMSIALLAIGIGLVKQRGMARLAAIYWSLAGFVVLGIRVWLFETKIWPQLQPFMNTVMQHAMEKQHTTGKDMPFDPSAFAGAIGHASQYVSVVVLAIFPGLLLLLMNLPSVKERLRSA
jgi:hypothetical protein